MASVKSKNTKPELELRSALHRRGLRFRLHILSLPGKPDIVLPKYRAVVFVNGCFWHQHSGCKKSTVPISNREYWNLKLYRNKLRDIENEEKLLNAGWRVFVVWDCQLKKSTIEEFADYLFLAIRDYPISARP